MGKRVIHECDLTKQEIDEDDTVFTLKLAKKGARSNMTYELSGAAAEKLLSQLNGRNELLDNWGFYAAQTMLAPANNSEVVRPRQTLGDMFDDDSSFVAEKKAELREQGVIVETQENEEVEERSQEGPVSKAMGATTDKCLHMNKGRIQTTMRKGKRFIFRKCQECRKMIPEKSHDDKVSYMDDKLPEGVRQKNFER